MALDRLASEVDGLKQRVEKSESLLFLLKSSPEAESLALLKRLRSGDEYSPDLAQVTLQDVGVDHRLLPEAQAARSVLPPTQSSMEFELMVRHPVSYPALIPVEAAHVELNKLLSPGYVLAPAESADRNLFVPVWEATIVPILSEACRPIPFCILFAHIY